MFSTRSKLGLR